MAMTENADLNNLINVEHPSVEEFLRHPDRRSIATFFLGWVFISSIAYITYSPFVHHLAHRISSHFKATPSPSLSNDVYGSEKVPSSPRSSITFIYAKIKHNSLVFVMNLCFAFAAIAHFGSLLSFSGGGTIACAFFVAWGNMASQIARLVGILILSLELRDMGVRRWESILFWLFLFVAFVGMFVTNAFTAGTIKPVYLLEMFLCYRTNILLASILSVAFDIALGLYLLIRIKLCVAPGFLKLDHQITGWKDPKMLKAVSLLFIEVMAMIPAAMYTNILAEFVPFSLGALGVLAAFNYQEPPPKHHIMHSLPASAFGPGTSNRGSIMTTLASPWMMSRHHSMLPTTLPTGSPSHRRSMVPPLPNPYSTASGSDCDDNDYSSSARNTRVVAPFRNRTIGNQVAGTTRTNAGLSPLPARLDVFARLDPDHDPSELPSPPVMTPGNASPISPSPMKSLDNSISKETIQIPKAIQIRPPSSSVTFASDVSRCNDIPDIPQIISKPSTPLSQTGQPLTPIISYRPLDVPISSPSQLPYASSPEPTTPLRTSFFEHEDSDGSHPWREKSRTRRTFDEKQLPATAPLRRKRLYLHTIPSGKLMTTGVSTPTTTHNKIRDSVESQFILVPPPPLRVGGRSPNSPTLRSILRGPRPPPTPNLPK